MISHVHTEEEERVLHLPDGPFCWVCQIAYITAAHRAYVENARRLEDESAKEIVELKEKLARFKTLAVAAIAESEERK